MGVEHSNARGKALQEEGQVELKNENMKVSEQRMENHIFIFGNITLTAFSIHIEEHFK